MQSTETSSNFEQTVLQQLEQIRTDVEQLKTEQALTNVRVDTYQKASNQVVNLAFGLIATATVTIIASVILK
jgi:regulatory protein YycI of two-component signal transduction system YycFG